MPDTPDIPEPEQADEEVEVEEITTYYDPATGETLTQEEAAEIEEAAPDA